jgi:peptidoglycan/LPS O-acetylase OafA/YrhL
MQVFIANPILQTYIFFGIFFAVLVATLRKRVAVGTFDVEVTQELKGFAILAIVFSHVGYFLATDHRFMFPLSVFAGVGVDIFLLLSGFGLTSSAFAKEMSPLQFYQKRLSKLYVPLWLVLAFLFMCDFIFLHHSYGLAYTARSFLGFFPHADIYNDIDSPLWYFSWIVFFYILFPLFFSRKRPIISAVAIFAFAWILTSYPPLILRDVYQLYQLHGTILRIRVNYMYYPVLAILAGAIAYLALHAPIGEWYLKAEMESIGTALLVVILFIIKRHEIGLFYVFGIFSFEVYLIHWPFMYRYDAFFKILPASVALSLFLVLFLGVGRVLQRATRRV